MGDAAIRRALEKGDEQDFEDTDLYARVFALAEAAEGKPLPRAVLPGIRLESPKITRKLTTAWFANRVNDRFKRCMRSEEHTSELQSLMRTSYAVFCLKK